MKHNHISSAQPNRAPVSLPAGRPFRIGLPPGGLAAALLMVLGCLVTFAPGVAHAQVNPPDGFSYQGYLTDGAGLPLATNAPKNYDVIFRIWDAPTGGTLWWTEQQAVTVDKGYFSVLLGEGSEVPGEPHDAIHEVFNAPDPTDRYVEMTVKGIGSGVTPDVTIQPRLRLLTTPYAFLATKAVNASALVNSSNTPVLTTSGSSLDIQINGNTTIPSANIGSASFSNAVIGSASISNASISGAVVSAATFSGDGAGVTNLNGANLNDGSVAGAKLADDAVTSAKLTNAAVTSVKLAPNIGVWDKSSGNISYSGGNVGVGMTPNASRLQVNGDVRLGANGSEYAASSKQNLRIVRGLIDPNGNVLSGSGTGFTVNSSGQNAFTITFTPAFSDVPAVTATAATASSGNVSINNLTTQHVVIYTWVSTAPIHLTFSFIAVGQR